jgi:hypothetical protein
VRSGRPIEPVETPQPEPLPSAPSSAPDIPVSTLVFTSHTDPRDHPITPLSEALADPTVPNKYRVRARVARIEPVPSKQPSDIIITFCTRCNQEFNADKCLSCNDAAYAYAEARWRMLVFLEIDAAEKRAAIESFAAARGRPVPAPSAFPSEHAVLLADAEAAAFLPPLPVLHTGPNEMHRARAQMRTLRDKAEDLLLGNRFDGLRTRPLIDWSVAKYAVPLEADNKRGKKDKDKEKDKVMEAERAESVVLWKVFGMRTK